MPCVTYFTGGIQSDCTLNHLPSFEDKYVVITPLRSGTDHNCPCCLQQKLQRQKQNDSGMSDQMDVDLPDLDEDSNPVYWNDQGHVCKLPEDFTGTDSSAILLGFTCFMKELDAALLILDVADPTLLDGLESMFRCEQHLRGVAVVIHLGPASAVQSQEYSSWMKRCPSFHVPVNSSSPQFGFRSSLRTIAKLNMIDQKIFPLPRHDETLKSPDERRPTFCGFLSRVILEKRCSGILVRMDHSNCFNTFNLKQFQQDFLGWRPQIEEQLLSRNSKSQPSYSSNQLAAAAIRQSLLHKRAVEARPPEPVSDFELLFLGTGSAEPSKYRGSSGILLQLGGSSMLLDAGEGVLGQIARRYGEKASSEIVQSLECIWLSHKHADHVLGAVSVISSRKIQKSPLLVIGSTAVGNWLKEVASAQALSGNPLPSFEFIHFEELPSERLRYVFEKLQLRNIVNVPVHHCYEAYGVVIHGQSGWRIVYSGDTRPSERLIRAGAGCTLLIHEATFEDCLEDHARRKRHCTVTEALQVSRQMQAQQVILTHFSQRYPKVVEIDTMRFPGSCVAFDGMVVNRLSMSCLPDLLPMVGLVLAEEEILEENKLAKELKMEEPKLAADSTQIRWSDLDKGLAKPTHIRWSDSDNEGGG